MDSKITIPIAIVVSVMVTAGVMYSAGFEDGAHLTPLQPSEILIVEKQFSPILNGTNEIRKISSQEELTDLLQASLFGGHFYATPNIARFPTPASMMESIPPSSAFIASEAPIHGAAKVGSDNYSSTNVQVENVDEPDYLKNDGRYVYIVSGNTLLIIDAYPAKDARLILKTALDIEHQYIQNMFLNGDRLVIFYNGQSDREIIPLYDFIPRQSHDPVTHALIIDITDRENPKILKDYSIDGYFMDARMVGDYAYFVTNSHIDHQYPRFPVILEDSIPIMTPDAFYFDNPEEFSNFNTLTAIDIFGDTINSETFLMGHTGTFYVSEDNFYLTYLQHLPFGYSEEDSRDRFFDVILPLLPSGIKDEIKSIQNRIQSDSYKVTTITGIKDEIKSIQNGSLGSGQPWSEISEIMQDYYDKMDGEQRDILFEKIREALIEYDARIRNDTNTVIHKISIDGAEIDHVAKGTVPGRLLNQFSMDESGDRFRVATTMEYYTEFEGTVRSNAVYVLDDNMETVGGLDGIAPDESIFSARFIDDRLYLVTFQQIDPFFVIDLSADTPEILGELKIPGFSNYLHPYDEEHIIGIGRDTKEIGPDRVQELGVKIALFDVRDVGNPKVTDEIIIGSRSTHSEALYSHKAFFFDKSRGILSIPITGDPNELDGLQSSKRIASEYRWSGFYVLDLDGKTGFDLKGTVTHSDGDGYYKMDNARTFYIDDVLYTASEDYLKMNSFDNLDEINSLKLGKTGGLVPYLEKNPLR